MAASETKREVNVYYTNYRGETASRRILPLRIWFGSNEWHIEPQWLLDAVDIEKGSERTFAMSMIHHWGGM